MNLTDIKMILETPDDPRLGRRIPPDFNHMEKYPLTAFTLPTKPVPVIPGVNWYSDFDRPVKDKDGKWWVGKDHTKLGGIRGGHCVCIPHDPKLDLLAWYAYYNQGEEGACVDFGSTRGMSLLNRKRYKKFWLWDRAKERDAWADTNPGDNNGTSVRAAMDVLRDLGHVRQFASKPDPKEGIAANRWAKVIEDCFTVLQNKEYERLGAMPFLNSWGKDYPHLVWMPCETWQRLMNEYGEFTMITDR